MDSRSRPRLDPFPFDHLAPFSEQLHGLRKSSSAAPVGARHCECVLAPHRTQPAGHGCWHEWRAAVGPSSQSPRYGSGTGSRSMTQPTAVTHPSTSRAVTPAIGVLPCSLSAAHPVSPRRKSPSHPSPSLTTEPLSDILIMTISPRRPCCAIASGHMPYLRYRDQSEKDDTGS
jgi:hypothetical protein